MEKHIIYYQKSFYNMDFYSSKLSLEINEAHYNNLFIPTCQNSWHIFKLLSNRFKFKSILRNIKTLFTSKFNTFISNNFICYCLFFLLLVILFRICSNDRYKLKPLCSEQEIDLHKHILKYSWHWSQTSSRAYKTIVLWIFFATKFKWIW